MNKTIGFKMCNEFGDKIKEKFLNKLEQEKKCYKTEVGKQLVEQDLSDEYKDILIHLCSIQRILDRTLGE